MPDVRIGRGGGLRGLGARVSQHSSLEGVVDRDQDTVACEMFVVTVIWSLGSINGSSNAMGDSCAKR